MILAGSRWCSPWPCASIALGCRPRSRRGVPGPHRGHHVPKGEPTEWRRRWGREVCMGGPDPDAQLWGLPYLSDGRPPRSRASSASRGWQSAWHGAHTLQLPRAGGMDVRCRSGMCCTWHGREGDRARWDEFLAATGRGNHMIDKPETPRRRCRRHAWLAVGWRVRRRRGRRLVRPGPNWLALGRGGRLQGKDRASRAVSLAAAALTATPTHGSEGRESGDGGRPTHGEAGSRVEAPSVPRRQGLGESIACLLHIKSVKILDYMALRLVRVVVEALEENPPVFPRTRWVSAIHDERMNWDQFQRATYFPMLLDWISSS